MTKLLVILAAWRLMRALAGIVVVVAIASAVLGYASPSGRAGHAPLAGSQPGVAAIEHQLQHTLEHALKP